MSIAEAALYATLALVCAAASGWLLCQFWHGWTGESDEYGPPLSYGWTPPPDTFTPSTEIDEVEVALPPRGADPRSVRSWGSSPTIQGDLPPVGNAEAWLPNRIIEKQR